MAPGRRDYRPRGALKSKTTVFVALCFVVAAGCSRYDTGSSSRTTEAPPRDEGKPAPASAPVDLGEAASQAARAADHRVEYTLETASRRGSLVYALRGDVTSWRIEQDYLEEPGGRRGQTAPLSAFILESKAETIFCMLEGAWQCFEGETSRESAPVLFDRRSFEFLAVVAPSVSERGYKKLDSEIAGYRASCFDIVPQSQLFEGGSSEEDTAEGAVPPLLPVAGVDQDALEILRSSLIVEVLYRGGTLCFGSGILLKMAILDEELFTIVAKSVSGPQDSDFAPPVPPRPVGTPSPFESVIEMS